MPRKRKPPDIGDALVYVAKRIESLRGPRRAIYELIFEILLEGGGYKEMRRIHRERLDAMRAPEQLCEECSAKAKDRPR